MVSKMMRRTADVLAAGEEHIAVVVPLALVQTDSMRS